MRHYCTPATARERRARRVRRIWSERAEPGRSRSRDNSPKADCRVLAARKPRSRAIVIGSRCTIPATCGAIRPRKRGQNAAHRRGENFACARGSSPQPREKRQVGCQSDGLGDVALDICRREVGQPDLAQQIEPDTGGMMIADEADHRHAHPQRFAGCRRAVIGERIERDVDLGIGIEVIHDVGL